MTAYILNVELPRSDFSLQHMYIDTTTDLAIATAFVRGDSISKKIKLRRGYFLTARYDDELLMTDNRSSFISHVLAFGRVMAASGHGKPKIVTCTNRGIRMATTDEELSGKDIGLKRMEPYNYDWFHGAYWGRVVDLLQFEGMPRSMYVKLGCEIAKAVVGHMPPQERRPAKVIAEIERWITTGESYEMDRLIGDSEDWQYNYGSATVSAAFIVKRVAKLCTYYNVFDLVETIHRQWYETNAYDKYAIDDIIRSVFSFPEIAYCLLTCDQGEMFLR